MKTRIFLLAVAAALWTTAVGQTKTIIEQQCWLDGNLSAVQPAGTSVDISALAPGVHTYSIRVKDSEGMWSPVVTKYFIIPRAIEPATNIAACEYWLDGNVALRASIDASPAQISLTDLAEGLHSFTIRVQDNNGVWSSPITKYFIKEKVVEPTTIARYMYWIDDDVANRVVGELTATDGILPVTLPGTLADGTHTLSWRVGDSKGVWSDVRMETFNYIDPYVLQQDEEGNYLLSTVKDWQEFAELVNGGNTTANARMVADIDLGNDQTMIGSYSVKYSGIFDGQGHTLTFHYNTAGMTKESAQDFLGAAPFRDIEGATIRNINTAGSITADKVGAAGLVGWVYGTSTIENCWSDVNIVSSNGTADTFTGFVAFMYGTSINIKDCIYTGLIQSASKLSHAGFIGYRYAGTSVLTNCIVILDEGSDPSRTSPCANIFYTFDRYPCNQSAGTYTNCYYYRDFGGVQGVKVTDEQLEDGTIAYKLQNDRADLVWGQRIGIDPEPVLTNDESYRVYISKNGGYTNNPEEAFMQDEEGYYLLGSLQDWRAFAELVNSGTTTANAKMTADIDLGDDQTMIGVGASTLDNNGSGYIKYQGTFDGQGHTLTIHYVAEDHVIAPFRFIQEATIKNLRVDGDITTAFRNAAGIVGICFGQHMHSYIENCISSVNIISSYVNNGDFYDGAWHGGIAARLHYYSQLHITDCMFNGSISGENKSVVWGGMLGIPDGTVTFTNCLQVGTFECSDVMGGYNGSGTISTVFSNGSASHININNCYYLNAIGNVQGTQATVNQLADGTIATALQAGRAEEIWVQVGSSTPMLKLFAPVCNIPLTEIDEIACDSFPWHGTMYYATEDITKTFHAVNGCDSVVTLHLIVNHSSFGEESQTAEGSYEWIDGKTYTESGDYTYTLTNVAGCDSVATLHLTITPPPPVWENGVLPGKFSINANGDQVFFSQGNLQYQATTDTWRFATNQYDMKGWGNQNISDTYDDWIDLFGWGTGNNPTNTSTNNDDYTVFTDWGTNAISNGGNTANMWRTMTNDEWYYLLNTRENAASLQGLGTVLGVRGAILLPDNWVLPDGASFVTDPESKAFTDNVYSTEESWSLMENAGAVFFPRACRRFGTTFIDDDGYYWSSSQCGSAAAFMFNVKPADVRTTCGNLRLGFSVRLVQAVPGAYVPQQDEDGYYLLSTVQDMLAFAALVNDGDNTANAKVINDIDLAGNEDNQWTPIGTESNKYKGTFDGQGYAIKNLYWHGNNQLNIGFFGYVDGAKIMNLRLEDADIYNPGQDGTTGKFVGGMVGHSANGNTLVINCSFSGSVTGMLEVGSMIGGGPAKVINCYNEGTVTFTSQTHYAAGGILGYNSNGITINNCYNVGDVINNGNPTDYMGAICYHGVTNSYYRENCCQNGTTAGWSNQGPGTVMSLDNMKTVLFVAALNVNVASLQATYPDISEWVQDPVTNLPILKIFAKAHDLVENQLEQDEEGNYLLGSVQDWQDFATLVQTTPTAKAKMTADINLGDDQTMVGTDAVPYAGIFDGQGHTLTVNYNIYSVETAVAPFACVNGATILNLHVAGSIRQRRCAAGGVVGSVNGNLTVKKCWVSATLTVDGEGNYQGTIGGIASCCDNSSVQGKSILLEDCLFSGYVATGIHCGGLMSHVHGESYNNSAAFNNCLNIGTCNGPSGSTGTFIRTGVQGDPYTITNCYYKTAWRVAQGAQATETELADGTTTAALQNSREEEIWVQDGDTPMLKIFASEITPVEPTGWENGVLPGKFSINANGDQVFFSQGNLQYFCSTTASEWRFAEHQYDYVPFDMSAYAENSEKWIDLFAHGTSGYDNGQTNYQPYVVGADPNTYYQGNLTGNAEWGYNAISNGGNTENFGWRTPTRDEWIYLFSGRTNAASKYGHGSINGVNGMILLPDKWTTPDGLSFTPGNSVWQNAYTIEQWSLMEEAGAVFLPASGSCNNVGIPSESLQNQNGFYRASTAAYYLYFSQGSIQNCMMSFYQYGDAVRLVQAVPSDPGPATSIDNTNANANAVKCIINGQLFILRGDKIYTLTGQKIR